MVGSCLMVQAAIVSRYAEALDSRHGSLSYSVQLLPACGDTVGVLDNRETVINVALGIWNEQ